MEPLVLLILANAAFVASHFAMSHPLRKAILSRFGEGSFRGVYSFVSLALFTWLRLRIAGMPARPWRWMG